MSSINLSGDEGYSSAHSRRGSAAEVSGASKHPFDTPLLESVQEEPSYQNKYNKGTPPHLRIPFSGVNSYQSTPGTTPIPTNPSDEPNEKEGYFSVPRSASFSTDSSWSSTHSVAPKRTVFVRTRLRTQCIRPIPPRGPRSHFITSKKSHAELLPLPAAREIIWRSAEIKQSYKALQAISTVLSQLHKEVRLRWLLRKEIDYIEQQTIKLGALWCEALALTKEFGLDSSTAVAALWERWSNLDDSQWQRMFKTLEEWTQPNAPSTRSLLEKGSLGEVGDFFHSALDYARSNPEPSTPKDGGIFGELVPSNTQSENDLSNALEGLSTKITTFTNNLYEHSSFFNYLDKFFVAVVPLIGVLTWQISNAAASIFAIFIVLARIGILIHTHLCQPSVKRAVGELIKESKKLNGSIKKIKKNLETIKTNNKTQKIFERLDRIQNMLDDLHTDQSNYIV